MRSQKIPLKTVLGLLFILALASFKGVAIKAQDTETSWRAEYFSNVALQGDPTVVREEAEIDFYWGTASPAPDMIGPDGFSVRWTNTITLTGGLYQFTTYTDDGVRLWVNDRQVIDDWRIGTAQAATGFVPLPAGPANIRMEYFDNGGEALARLIWTQVAPLEQIPALANPPLVITATVVDAQDAAPLNIRSGPGLEFAPLATVALGQNLDLIGRDESANWMQVRLADGRIGWASGQFLVSNFPLTNLPVVEPSLTSAATVTATTPSTSTGGLAAGTVVNTTRLNVRTGPELTSDVFASLLQNQAVILEGRNANGTWLQVRLPDGQLGWVSGLYITPNLDITNLPVNTPTDTGTETPAVGGAATGTVISAARLNVRTGPGLTFDPFATLTQNQVVTLEGRNADGTWLQVRLADGQLGWVSSLFITPNLDLANLPVTG